MDTYADEIADKAVSYSDGMDFMEDTKVQRIQTGFAKPLTSSELAGMDDDDKRMVHFGGDRDDDDHTDGYIERVQTGYVH